MPKAVIVQPTEITGMELDNPVVEHQGNIPTTQMETN